MRNRSGYMINPLTGRQVKMNGKIAKNVFKMVGGSPVSEDVFAQPSAVETNLETVKDNLSQTAAAMEQNLNNQKAQVSAAEEAMNAAKSAQEEAEKKTQEANSAIDAATVEKDAALERETFVKEDLLELGKLMSNLSASLEKTSKKSKETDTSPFCTFERLEKSLTEEDKEKLKTEEAKKLFDEVTGFIGSVSGIVSTTVNYLGLFSSENRGRKMMTENDSMNNTMLGGGKKRKQRRSGNKRR